MAEFNLGDTAKDTITGFEGIVIGIHKWLNGCTSLTIQPPKLDKEGVPMESKNIDAEQCVLLKAAKKLVAEKSSGGPKDHPTRRLAP